MKLFKLGFWAVIVFWFGFMGLSTNANVSADYGYGYTNPGTTVKNNYGNIAGKIVVATKAEAWEYKKLPVAILCEKFGYNWEKDRETLAKKVWIRAGTYKGTYDQNMKIKNYFDAKIIIEYKSDPSIITSNLPVIYVSSYQANQLKNHTITYDLVKEFGFDWNKDRYTLAKKIWIKSYYWSRSQNMKIREAFKVNIKIK